MIDLNTVQSIYQLTIIDENIIDRELLSLYQERVKDQYISFNNLGLDLISDIDPKYKVFIYGELLEYVNNNYVGIINIDDSLFSQNIAYEIGEYVYRFICVDCFNTVIPNYLEKINCINNEQFEIYLKNNLDNDSVLFKVNFIKIINNIIEDLLKLKNIDINIDSDDNYKMLIKRYGFYSELVNHCNGDDLLYNYFIPIIRKNQADIAWRLK